MILSYEMVSSPQTCAYILWNVTMWDVAVKKREYDSVSLQSTRSTIIKYV